jgi:hypothetical protein
MAAIHVLHIGTLQLLRIILSNTDNLKIKFSLCLTKHEAMTTSGEVDARIDVFLTSALLRGNFQIRMVRL